MNINLVIVKELYRSNVIKGFSRLPSPFTVMDTKLFYNKGFTELSLAWIIKIAKQNFKLAYSYSCITGQTKLF